MDALKDSKETEKGRNGETGRKKESGNSFLRFPDSPIPRFASSIRTQLIVGVTVVTVGAIALIGFLSVKMLEWNALYRKGKEAEVIAIFIQTIIQERQGREGEGLKVFAAKIAERGIIKDITIVDENGKASFITGRELISSKDDSKNLFFISGLNVKMIGGGWFAGVGKELLVSAPLKHGSVASSQGPGSINFSMSLSDIREEVSNFKSFILFYAIFDSIIIIIFGTYLFSRGIIRPMKLLKETTESIAGGMLGQRVDIKAGGEIGSFASSFNIMADRLEEKIKTLERLNKELIITQEELIRSEKLATVGRLAAGVAHEIGNPLGAMLGYVDILKKQGSGVRGLPPSVSIGGQESEEILQRLEKEIARIDAIVRELLDFSRPSAPISGTKDVLQDVDVNKIVKDVVAMLLPQFSNSAVSFDMRLNNGIPHTLVDEGKLQQVLLNLFLNARDAMEGVGAIIVETAEAAMPEQNRKVRVRQDDTLGVAFIAMRSHIAANDCCIKISITDSGRGIAKSDIGKIFDPFFTTKDQGKGTGLGLTVSLGIIQAYGGDIKVRSELGKGTTFEVFLPCSRNL